MSRTYMQERPDTVIPSPISDSQNQLSFSQTHLGLDDKSIISPQADRERISKDSLATMHYCAAEMADGPTDSVEKGLEKPQLGAEVDKNYSKLFSSAFAFAAAFKQAGILDDMLTAVPTNSEQAYFLKALKVASKELDKLPDHVIKSVAGVGPEALELVNKKLDEWGMPEAKLKDRLGPSDIAFAGMVSVKGGWTGIETETEIDGTTYRAVNLSARDQDMQIFEVDGHKAPVVRLSHQDGHSLYVTEIPEGLTPWQQTELAGKLASAEDVRHIRGYDGAVVPFMHKEESGSLEALLGFGTDSMRLTQANGAKKLKLDAKEYSLLDAGAGAASRAIAIKAMKPLVVNGPRVMVFAVADGTTQPLSVFHVGKENYIIKKK